MTLLELARTRDLPELHRRLQQAVDRFNGGWGQMSEGEKLLDEALTFARLGDVDEVIHLLERRAHPKWHDIVECKRQYDAAMQAKRAAVAT